MSAASHNTPHPPPFSGHISVGHSLVTMHTHTPPKLLAHCVMFSRGACLHCCSVGHARVTSLWVTSRVVKNCPCLRTTKNGFYAKILRISVRAYAPQNQFYCAIFPYWSFRFRSATPPTFFSPTTKSRSKKKVQRSRQTSF